MKRIADGLSAAPRVVPAEASRRRPHSRKLLFLSEQLCFSCAFQFVLYIYLLLFHKINPMKAHRCCGLTDHCVPLKAGLKVNFGGRSFSVRTRSVDY